MLFSKNSPLSVIMSTEVGKVVLRKLAPNLFTYPGSQYVRGTGVTLINAIDNKLLGISPECVLVQREMEK